MTFELRYASRTTHRVTRVAFREERDAHHWYGMVLHWQDVLRAALYTGKEVICEARVEHRFTCEAEGDLAASLSWAGGPVFEYRQPRTPEQSDGNEMRFVDSSADRCRCGHLEIQHTGASSKGRCIADGCTCRWMYKPRTEPLRP